MKQIHVASLVNFQPQCTEHVEALRKIKDYNFNKNIHLIKSFLESTDFTGGIYFDDNDFKKFIVEDTFMIGIDVINDDLDDCRYLFDAFNVYFSTEDFKTYLRDPRLTKTWRIAMKTAFPNGKYEYDAKMSINQERKEALAQINADYNEEIESL